MPDTTMCVGGECPLKQTCHRFKAPVAPKQAFFSEPPYEPEHRECLFYVKVMPKETRK